MDAAALLADPEAIRLTCTRQRGHSIILIVQSISPRSICPQCHRPSTHVHSRYVRRVADLPWQGIAVRLEMNTRRFCGKNSLCRQRIFCERLPRVVASYARKTVRLNGAMVSKCTDGRSSTYCGRAFSVRLGRVECSTNQGWYNLESSKVRGIREGWGRR